MGSVRVVVIPVTIDGATKFRIEDHSDDGAAGGAPRELFPAIEPALSAARTYRLARERARREAAQDDLAIA